MTFQKFTLGLVAAFGLPWLLLIVIPFGKMRSIEPIEFDETKDEKTGVYAPKRAGRIADGSAVYGANGCYVCHTQVIRPTYAGSEIWRDDWAGLKKNADDNDTRRESTVWDYQGERIAHIGLTRNGPDLSNVGYRLEKSAAEFDMSVENYIYTRLMNPRSLLGNHWSTCPSQPQLFSKPSEYAQIAETFSDSKGAAFIPDESARALASYLQSLKKDDALPYAANYRRDK